MNPLLIDLTKYSDEIYVGDLKLEKVIIDISNSFFLCDKEELSVLVNNLYFIEFKKPNDLIDFFEDIETILYKNGLIEDNNSFSEIIEGIYKFYDL
jgi:hypothetical protein